MKRNPRPRPRVEMPSGFAGFRFPPEVILLAVRWYLRYGLSYRDLEELLAERGIEVDHVTLYRWVQRFTPQLIDAARPFRHLAGGRWFVDETYVKVSGVWRYVYRAVDQHGQVIDVYVPQRRDIAAARKFFTAALTVHGDPIEVITDPGPGLGERDRGADSCGVAQHRPVREQPRRIRPRAAEGQAPADARAEDPSNRECGDPRPRLHPEPTSGPLRAAIDASRVFRLATAFDELKPAI